MSSEQEAVERWVSKELIYNVSPMVIELAAIANDSLGEVLLDMAYGLPHYEAAATDEGWELLPNGDFVNPSADDCSYTNSWENLCDEKGIDASDYCPEAMEYWLVSDRLGEQLALAGERVTEKLLGIGPIWSRTTTGQAVSMDEVIIGIYNKVMGK